MDHADQTRNVLIKALRGLCKTSVQLEKLDHERKSLEQALDGAWRSYRQLMEDTPTALLLVDPQAAIVASNKTSQLLLGYSAEELLGTSLEDLCEENGSSAFAQSLRNILEESAVAIKDLSTIHKGGTPVLVDALLNGVTHEDKTLVLVTLSEARECQTIPLHDRAYVGKLEAVSRSTTALLRLPPTESIYEALGDQVSALVENAHVLVSSFSRETDIFSLQAASGPEKQAGTISELLRRLVGTSYRLTPEDFEKHTASCTPATISETMAGLFRDKLRGETRDGAQDLFPPGSTYAAGLTAGKEVLGMVLILVPTGVILEYIRPVTTLLEQASLILRFREPEPTDYRTGISETLVEDFQSILLEELPLPLEHKEVTRRGEPHPHHALSVQATSVAQEKPQQQQSAGETVRKAAREFEPEQDYRHLRHLLAHKKILVIDGEEIIRDVTGGLLSYMGCRVGFAKDGYDGLSQYKKALASGEPYDAVILALALPGDLSPKETCQRLRQMDPGAKVVGSTGAAGESLVTDVREAGFRAVIVRPYQGDRLANILHKVLNDYDILHKQRT